MLGRQQAPLLSCCSRPYTTGSLRTGLVLCTSALRGLTLTELALECRPQ